MNSNGEPFRYERAEESTGFLLWQVTTLWQRGIKKTLEPFDLTQAQYVLLASLMWLSKNQQTVTQIDLAIHSKIDPMTTSTVLRTLQKKGFLQRQEHHTDTRAKAVMQTPEGIRQVEQAIRAVEQFDQDFFTGLGGELNGFNRQLIALTGQH